MNSHIVFGLFIVILSPLLVSLHPVSGGARPIRDFIDYNAREDGDEIIALPSNGQQSVFIKPPSARSQATQGFIRGSGSRRSNPSPNKELREFEPNLFFRDESAPGGRRGF